MHAILFEGWRRTDPDRYANAGFWAAALVTAVCVAGPGARARATSVVVGGVTVACVVGVPAGAVLGGHWGWHAAFWAVALVSVPALAVIARTIPGGRAESHAVGGRAELRSLTEPRLALTLLTSALVQGATFCAFSYLESLVTRVTGVGAGWVPAVLALFRAGSFLGVTVAGRIVDARPVAVTTAGPVALTAGWAGLALTAGSPAAVVALVLVQGMLAFGTGTALISRALQSASDAPALAGSFSTAAFNVGGALGPRLGGITIGAGFGFRSPLWVSALLMVLALDATAALSAYDALPTLNGRGGPSLRKQPASGKTTGITLSATTGNRPEPI